MGRQQTHSAGSDASIKGSGLLGPWRDDTLKEETGVKAEDASQAGVKGVRGDIKTPHQKGRRAHPGVGGRPALRGRDCSERGAGAACSGSSLTWTAWGLSVLHQALERQGSPAAPSSKTTVALTSPGEAHTQVRVRMQGSSRLQSQGQTPRSKKCES